MADIRSLGGSSLVPQRPVARNETVRAAQRAFFQAALANTPSTPAPAPRGVQASLTPAASAAPPDRILRPGSLLDIKV